MQAILRKPNIEQMETAIQKNNYELPLTILRIWLGIAFIMHGLPGIFNADFMAGHVGMMEYYNIPAPGIMAYLSKGGELLAGLLLLFGIFTRFGALIVIINMTVATFLAMRGDIFEDFQAQMSFTYLVMGVAILIGGVTSFSLDRLMAGRKGVVS